MKIMIVTHNFPPELGGASSRSYDLAKYLKLFGNDIDVYSPPPSYPFNYFPKFKRLLKKEELDNFKIYRLWTWQPSKEDPKFFSRVIHYLLFPILVSFYTIFFKKKYDRCIVISPPLFLALIGILHNKLKGTKWIFDSGDLWIDASIDLGFIKKGSLKEKLARSFEEFCLRDSFLIRVTSETQKKELLKHYNVDKNKIEVIYNGADIDLFKSTNQKKEKIIVYTGRFGYAQKLENVILAMEKVRKDFRLLLIGDGEEKNKLIKLIREKKFESRITICPSIRREEIPSILDKSILGFAPLANVSSLNYAIPTKIYEYMATGLPFLACGQGEVENVARLSKAGVVCENNADEIARTINRLIKDKQRLKKMSLNARKFAETHFNRKKIALRILEKIK